MVGPDGEGRAADHGHVRAKPQCSVTQAIQLVNGPELLHGQGGQAEFGEPPVVGGGLADDGVRLGAERDGDDATVVDEVTDGLEAGHHAIDRPAEVDRGRTGRAERCRSCPEDCPASEGQGLLGSLGR